MKKLLRVLVIAALLVAIAIPCLASGTETTAPHVHDFEGWTVVQPSTCIAEGKMTRVCKADGCNLPDNTETKIIAKKDHTWGDPEVGTPATCTKEGEMIQKCKTEGCTATKKAGTIPMVAHKFVKKHLEQAPKCGVDGWTSEEYCSTCNKRYDYVTVPATDKDHDWERVTVKSKTPCSVPSYTVLKCKTCGKVDESSKINLKLDDHKPSEKTYLETEATCTAPEMRYANCTVCGARLKATANNDKPALGHDWADWKVVEAATCTKKGKSQETCSRCHEVRYGELPVVAHEWVDYKVVTPATCTEKGKAQETCKVGGEVRFGEIAALGHDYEWVETKKVDKCHDGEMQLICKNCKDVKQTEVIKGGEHEWSTEPIVAKKPTCTEKGVKAIACKNCGEIKEGSETEEIPALGHKAGEWVTVRQPSASQEGKMIQKCTVCGTQLGKKYIRATGTTTAAKTVAYVAGTEVANYAKIDLTVDATTELDLVSANGTKVGKLVVEVKEGKVTVKYELSAVPADAFLTFVAEAPAKDVHAQKEFEFEKAISVADELAGAAAAYIYVEIEY